MRWSSQAVDPQGVSGIGGDGRHRGVVRYLAFRSRCRVSSIRVAPPVCPPDQTKDGLQMSDRSITDSYRIDNREPTSSITNPPQTLCQQRLSAICHLADTYAIHDVPMERLDELLRLFDLFARAILESIGGVILLIARDLRVRKRGWLR